MAAPTSAPAVPSTNGDAQKKAAKSKNALRRQKAKAKKAHGESQSDREGSVATTGYATTDVETDNEGNASLVTPSTSVDDLTIDTSDPAYAEYVKIMDKFQGTDAEDENKEQVCPESYRLLDARLTRGLDRMTDRKRRRSSIQTRRTMMKTKGNRQWLMPKR